LGRNTYRTRAVPKRRTGRRLIGAGDLDGTPFHFLVADHRSEVGSLPFGMGHRHPPVDLISSVRFRVGENRLASVPHPLQASPHGIDCGGHPSLKHRHRETNSSASSGILARCHDRLVFNVAGQLIVEIEFIAIELKPGRMNLPLGEELPNFPSFRVGKRDKSFLDAPQVERSFVLPHRLFQTLDVAVYIFVEQREEQAKVLRVAFVWCRRHQQ
jgi:hypothetical protein